MKPVFILILFLLFSKQGYAEDPQQLVIASPHWEGIRREFERAFEEKEKSEGRAVTFHWLDLGGTSDILKYLIGEFQRTGKTAGVDLVFGGGIDPFLELKSRKLLACGILPEEATHGIPQALFGNPLIDSDRCWFAASLAGFGILYNKAVLNELQLPEPITWEDAANPRYESWVGTADPRKSGSVHMVYEIILQAYGWERGWKILYGIGANARNFASASTQTARDAAVGEIAIGFVIDAYARDAEKNAGTQNIGFVIPDNLSPINGDGIALLQGAPHPDLGKSFMEYVLSEEGQKLFLLNQNRPDGPRLYTLERMSVRPSLYSLDPSSLAVNVNPFKLKSTFTYDAKKGARRWNIVNDLIGSFIIDVQPLLKRAQHGLGESIGSKLGSPVNEAAVEEMIDGGSWEKEQTRSQLLHAWANAARAQLVPFASEKTYWKYIPTAILFSLVLGLIISRRRKRLSL